jgi:tetratricopeptide (TPR) repeat protein
MAEDTQDSTDDTPEDQGNDQSDDQATPSTSPKDIESFLHKALALAKAYAKRPTDAIIPAIAHASSIFVVALFCTAIFDRSPIIQPLSVPKSMADDGVTGDVVAGRLRDRISLLISTADSAANKKNSTLKSSADLPDLSVPSIGMSVQGVASLLANLLPLNKRPVLTGEVTAHDGKFSILLRWNGQLFYRADPSTDATDFDSLLGQAAMATLGEWQPQYLALLIGFHDPEASLAKLEDAMNNPSIAESGRLTAAYYKATLLVDLGRPDDAYTVLQGVERTHPKSPLLHLGFAYLHSWRGETDQAERSLLTAQQYDQNNSDPHLLRGDWYWDGERLDEARQEYNAALKCNPDAYDVRIRQGDLDLYQYYDLPNQRRFEKRRKDLIQDSLTNYRRALAINSLAYAAHIGIGKIYVEQWQSSQDDSLLRGAATEFSLALAEDGEDLEARAAYADVLRKLKQIPEAQNQLRKVMEAQPKTPADRWKLAQALEDNNQAAKAIEVYRDLAGMVSHAQQKAVHYRIALAYSAQNQTTAALQELDALIAEFQDFGPAYIQKAALLAATKRDDSISLYSKGLEYLPNRSDARSSRGALFYKAGRYKDAEDDFRILVKEDPDNADYHYDLGESLAYDPATLPEAISELRLARDKTNDLKFLKQIDHEIQVISRFAAASAKQPS